MNVKKAFGVAGFATAGLLAMLGQVHADTQPQAASDDAVTCREITRRVTIWPQTGNPGRGVRPATFETRKYRVCMRDGARIQQTRIAAL
jgi:hypothetical protein